MWQYVFIVIECDYVTKYDRQRANTRKTQSQERRESVTENQIIVQQMCNIQ